MPIQSLPIRSEVGNIISIPLPSELIVAVLQYLNRRDILHVSLLSRSNSNMVRKLEGQLKKFYPVHEMTFENQMPVRYFVVKEGRSRVTVSGKRLTHCACSTLSIGQNPPRYNKQEDGPRKTAHHDGNSRLKNSHFIKLRVNRGASVEKTLEFVRNHNNQAKRLNIAFDDDFGMSVLNALMDELRIKEVYILGKTVRKETWGSLAVPKDHLFKEKVMD